MHNQQDEQRDNISFLSTEMSQILQVPKVQLTLEQWIEEIAELKNTVRLATESRGQIYSSIKEVPKSIEEAKTIFARLRLDFIKLSPGWQSLDNEQHQEKIGGKSSQAVKSSESDPSYLSVASRMEQKEGIQDFQLPRRLPFFSNPEQQMSNGVGSNTTQQRTQLNEPNHLQENTENREATCELCSIQ